VGSVREHFGEARYLERLLAIYGERRAG
jgi:hypothetical protein